MKHYYIKTETEVYHFTENHWFEWTLTQEQLKLDKVKFKAWFDYE